MKPIYEPKGKAKEYGDLAINIYTGCPHRCYYCFAPRVLHRDKEEFHSHVEPRPNIVQAVKSQIEREKITGKLIHLCFTCDPYPTGYDTSPTREIIKIIKESGNHVQILTKGDGSRDFDLLDKNDWYGITLTGKLGDIKDIDCVLKLQKAKFKGIKTWVSFEPVLDAQWVLEEMRLLCEKSITDKIAVGKLNYYPSNIDWKTFGREAELVCKKYGAIYYIKDSLRQEMDKE